MTTSIVPSNTPFNYNLGIDYETWENGRTGRSISADLDQIGQYIKLVRTYHDAAVGVPPGSAPVIDPTQAEAITYIVNHPGMQLVMGTNNNAVASGGFGTAWSAGLMNSSTYTDQWVQMIIGAFGNVANVQASLSMIQLGNELDSNGPPPTDPAFPSYQGWIETAFNNLKASMAAAGLGSIPISTTIANYPVGNPTANPIAYNTTQYIIGNWSSGWNANTPIVFFNQYTQAVGGNPAQSTNYQPVIDYFNSVSTSLASPSEVFIGETGYSSFYGLTNEVDVYNQISTWLNGQYTSSGHMTVPLFAFDAFDQPAITNWQGQYGIFAQSATFQPTGLKTGLTLPTWSATPINTQFGSATNDVMYGFAPNSNFFAGNGNDVIAASSGSYNKVIYWSPSTHFAVTATAGHQDLTVQDRIGSDGTDNIFHIEQLQYSDKTIEVSWLVEEATLAASELAPLVELYSAYLDRAPDAAGLAYWASRHADGMSLSDIAKSFYISPEALANGPHPTTPAALVAQAYQTVLGRAPDAAGATYWQNELSSGRLPDHKLALALMMGAVAPGGNAADAQYVANHLAAGAHFALEQGLTDLAQARAVDALVTGSADSVTAANQLTDSYAQAAAQPDTAALALKLAGMAEQLHFW
ncbi:MAG: DUF4214 domain-containing protein [Reyranellaceae bacterium]